MNQKQSQDIPELNEKINVLGKLTKWMVDRHRMVYLVICTIMIAGAMAFTTIPRESMPEVILPYAEVMVYYPGASPEDIEALITNKIEKEVSGLKDLEEVQSFSYAGLARLSLQFEFGINTAIKKTEILNAMNRIEFPNGVETPEVMFYASSGEPVLGINLYGEYGSYQLSEIGNVIKDRLELIKGVDKVTVVGDVKREIHVYIDTVQLMNYGLSLSELQQALMASNFTLPAGDGNLDGTHYNIRIDEGFQSIEEIKHQVIKNRRGELLLLKDIAEIADSHEKITHMSQINIKSEEEPTSKTSIYLSVVRTDGADVIGLVDEIKEVLVSEKGFLYPQNLNLFYWNDESIEVSSDLNSVVQNALSGLFVVVSVLFLFIGFRESIIVSFVIPLTLLTTIAYLNYQGMSLNVLTILGLIVSLGLLVDNAIVVMENIDRLRSKGIDKLTASKAATNQVAPAIFASTMTTIAAFVPLMILPGDIGAFITVLPKTIIVALAVSLGVSLLITPTLCARLLPDVKEQKKQTPLIKVGSVVIVMAASYYAFSQNGKPSVLAIITSFIFGIGMWLKQYKLANKSFEESRLIQWYEVKIKGIIISRKKRIGLIVIALVMVVLSILTIPLGILNVGLMQYDDLNELTVEIEAPYGTPFEETYDITLQIESLLNRVPEVAHYGSLIGGDNPHEAKINVEIVDKTLRERHLLDVVEDLREQTKYIPGAIVYVSPAEEGSMEPGRPFQLRFKGTQIEQLKEVGYQVVEALNKTSGIINPTMNLQDGIPQLKVDINKKKAIALGLNPQLVAMEVRGYVSGIEAGIFTENEKEYDILIKSSKKWIDSVDDLHKIHFISADGNKVPFDSIVTLKVEKGMTMIRHIDYNRVVVVGADIDTGANLNEIMATFMATFDERSLPEGITMEVGGEEAEMNEAFLGMFQSMIIAMILVFIILVVQFNSIVQPFIILLTLPMGLIGVIGGLLVTGNDFGFYAFMGLVALVGIVVNDAIVLVDYTNYLKRNGLNQIDAIVEGAKTRFIPVFATSITTIGGILPLAVKNIYYAQLGYGIVFGLLVATVMTLVYIPIFYSFLVKSDLIVEKQVFIPALQEG